MSSPLDARIRRLAREELQAGAAPAVADSTDRVAALEKEVAELRGDLKRVSARLDALSSAGETAAEDKPATRRTRKTASTE